MLSRIKNKLWDIVLVLANIYCGNYTLFEYIKQRRKVTRKNKYLNFVRRISKHHE